MEKVQKFKAAAANNRQQDFSQELKEMLLVPWRACKLVWNWIVNIWRKVWAWVRSLDIAGMVNLTLLIIIVVLFISLVMNLVHGRRHKNVKMVNSDAEVSEVLSEINNDNGVNVDNIDENTVATGNVSVVDEDFDYASDKRPVHRDYDMVLPMKKDESTGITPQIQVVGVEKPVIIEETATPADELPEQKLYGDVIVDKYAGAPVLSNGVNVDGNLFIQNMRKYTLPCDATITGNLFVRNVERLRFCGKFTVKGNVYVNRQSSFGPIPQDAKVGGQVIL